MMEDTDKVKQSKFLYDLESLVDTNKQLLHPSKNSMYECIYVCY